MIVSPFIRPGNLYADMVDTKIILGIAEEYQDNLFFDEHHGKKAWASVLSSRVDLKKDTERLKIGLVGEADYSIYKKYHDLDNDDWSVSNSLLWSPSETVSCSSSVTYGNDSNIDRYLSTTGILLDTRDHEHLNWDLSLSRRLYERLSTVLNLGFSDETFRPADQSESDYSLSTYSASSGLIYQADELTSLNLYLGYAYYDYPTSTVDQVYVSLGMNRNISETLAYFLSLGTRSTTYRYEIITGIDDSVDPVTFVFGEKKIDTHGFIGRAGVTYNQEDHSLSLSVDQNLQPSSGQSQSVSRTSVSASLNKRFTSDLNFSVFSNYYYNRSDDPDLPNAVYSKSYRVGSSLSYLLSKSFSVQGNYSYSEYWTDHYKANKNIYGMKLTYNF